MDQTIQAPQDASAETQAILKELEAEGKGTPAGQEPAKPVEQPKAPEPKVEQPAKTPEELAAEQAEQEGKKEKIQRTENYVPVSKHNEERHKRQEAERAAEAARKEAETLRAQIERASSKPNTEQIDEKAARLAEKHGIDPDLAKDLLLEANSGQQALAPDLEADLKAIKEIRAQEEQRSAMMAQETHFNNELAQVIKEFPDLADRKEELKQLAFSEGNINTPLRLLAIGYRHDNPPEKPGRKTAESPVQTGKNTGAEVIDFAEMTEEQFRGLNDEQYDSYMEWLSKKPKK